jgi:hypothetical protein
MLSPERIPATGGAARHACLEKSASAEAGSEMLENGPSLWPRGAGSRVETAHMVQNATGMALASRAPSSRCVKLNAADVCSPTEYCKDRERRS